jgi:lipocalin
MIRFISFVALAATAATAASAATSSPVVVTTTDAQTPTNHTCPPPNFSSKQNFNPATYFKGRWYSLIQLPVAYQPEEIFYCTTADYQLLTTPECQVSGCDDKYVDIINRSKRGSINGNSSSINLRGLVPDKNAPSKAVVGFPTAPPSTYGPYWVIEAGTYADLLADKQEFTGDNYEWVLISGAEPEFATDKGCLPGFGPTNTNGLWILSREPVVSKKIFKKALRLAKSKGFDVTAMKPVAQEGCVYE